jgi:hypothetical protein
LYKDLLLKHDHRKKVAFSTGQHPLCNWYSSFA